MAGPAGALGRKAFRGGSTVALVAAAVPGDLPRRALPFDRPTCVVYNKGQRRKLPWRLRRQFTSTTSPARADRQAARALPGDLRPAARGGHRQRPPVDPRDRRHRGDPRGVSRRADIQDLHARAWARFNEAAAARCSRAARAFRQSVLGGGASPASWFGGVNGFHSGAAGKSASGAYGRWFDRFGARVVAAATPDELRAAVASDCSPDAGPRQQARPRRQQARSLSSAPGLAPCGCRAVRGRVRRRR